jgi:aldose 1-epimerase
MSKTEIYDEKTGTKRYWISNKNGMQAAFLERGATMTTLTSPDKDNKFENTIIELKDFNEYLNNTPYMAVVPGRYANRIAKGKFTIDGVEYNLNKNDNGKNHLHGGNVGFDKKNWTMKELKDNSITFEYLSPDGEENFPGNLKATVTYTLNDDNSLEVNYKAETDKSTHCNLSQHAYFNLSGNYKNQSIDHYQVKINANGITEVDDELIPTGKILPVENTVYDFRESKKLSDIKDYAYDHNFCLNTKGDKEMFQAAEVYDSESGRVMEIFTNYPGMQFYTANFLDGSNTAANGSKCGKKSAFCMETQFYPDSPNHAEFPSTLLKPGDVYDRRAIFKFSVRK